MSVITCKAAVAWEMGKPLVIEEITVDPPKAHEVRLKVLNTGVCGTDTHALAGIGWPTKFPVVFGHEAACVVESVGEGVTHVAPGDHVIPMYNPDCGECNLCKSGKTNLCSKITKTAAEGLLPDGTSRMHCKGKDLYQFLSCSTFSQYTVVADICVAKIDPAAPANKVCLIGCGITTGYGAALFTADVKEDETVAIFGAGTVGLSAVQGAHVRGAKRIIVVDVDNKKKDLCTKFGATEFINPKEIEGTIEDYLVKITDGGLDWTFDASGNVGAMSSALAACKAGWGTSVVIGVAPPGKKVEALPIDLIFGRRWIGSFFGGAKGRSQLPVLVDHYMQGKLRVQEYISDECKLSEINKAIDDLNSGRTLRTVVYLFD